MRGFEYVASEHKKNTNDTQLPFRKTAHSAGYDFPSPINIKLKPREQKMIWMDFKAYMQPSECLLVYIRSSLAVKYNITLCNNVGVIDSDYFSNPSNDGNIGICLRNNGRDTVEIKEGDYIAQGIFTNYLVGNNCNYGEHYSREGGFGSTDQKAVVKNQLN